MMSKTKTHLIVDAGVRYWEDSTVNGQVDADGGLIPFRVSDRWCPVIELATGKILDWPSGTTASIHYKVCDDGEYWLGNAAGLKTVKWKGSYVPCRLLCVGDFGYGDYIILTVDGDGIINGWERPIINADEWESIHAK